MVIPFSLLESEKRTPHRFVNSNGEVMYASCWSSSPRKQGASRMRLVGQMFTNWCC
jgi:hypothetical protein